MNTVFFCRWIATTSSSSFSVLVDARTVYAECIEKKMFRSSCCCLFLHRVHCEILWFRTDCFRGAACHRMVAALRCAAAKSARCRSLLVRLLHFLDCRIKWQLLSNVRCCWHFYCGGLYVLLSLPRVSRRKHFVTLFSIWYIKNQDWKAVLYISFIFLVSRCVIKSICHLGTVSASTSNQFTCRSAATTGFLCLWTHGPFYAECIEKPFRVSAKSIPLNIMIQNLARRLTFSTDCFRGATCHRMVAALRRTAAKSARCRSLPRCLPVIPADCGVPSPGGLDPGVLLSWKRHMSTPFGCSICNLGLW